MFSEWDVYRTGDTLVIHRSGSGASVNPIRIELQGQAPKEKSVHTSPALQRGPRIPQDWQLMPAAPHHDAIPRILIEAMPDVQRVAFEGWLATNRQRPDTYRPSAYYADYVLWYCEYFQREVILHKVEGGRHD